MSNTMQAICTTADRTLEVREIPRPTAPPAGHLLIQMQASAINPGDKIFLSRAAPMTLHQGQLNVWGASGVGRVIGVGAGVPAVYANKQVAIYRSMASTPEMVGLWCET